MGVNSLPKTVTRQRRGCDLNPGPSAPESSMLTTRLPSHPPAVRIHDGYLVRWGRVDSVAGRLASVHRRRTSRAGRDVMLLLLLLLVIMLMR